MTSRDNDTPFLSRKGGILLFGLFLAAIWFVFHGALAETLKAWNQEEYSHGYLVPLVGVILLLNKVQDESSAGLKNSWWGLAAMAVCLAGEFLFVLAGIGGLQPLLLVAFFLAFFVTLCGVPFSLKMAGPLLFFVFLAPLPKFLYYTISFNMQLLASHIGTVLLQAVGVSVFQEGNIIDLVSYQLEVAEACNGLRYLFPLMALGYLLACMYRAPLWKRALLFLSTVPVTIAMNGLRIFVIGLTVNAWGPAMAERVIHDLEGWIVFLGCLLVLAVEVVLLQKIGAKGHLDFDVLGLPPRRSLSVLFPVPWRGAAKAAVVLLCAALIGQGVLVWSGGTDIRPVPLAKPLSTFPMQISEWTGRMGSLDQASLDVLGTGDYLIADYTNPAGESVNLYMLYYPKQDSTSNQAIHTPEVCIPAGGWEIADKSVKAVSLPNGKEIKVNRLIIAKGLERQLVYFWFVQGATLSYDANMAKFVLIKNTLLDRKANGSMIRVLTTASGELDDKSAEQRLESFISENLATINEYVGM